MEIQILFSLISGILISGTAGYLGTLMLSRKMSVVAGPLAHLALPGVALAILFGFSLFLGAFPFIILGAFFIWILERKTKLPMENLAAIIFASSVGVALLILPIGKAEEALVGNILEITALETLAVILLSLLTIFIILKIYQKIILLNIHEDLASIEGFNTSFYNFLYLLSIAIVVSMGVYLVGGLITVALIAMPAASARNISFNIKSYKIWAIFFGIIPTISGIIISNFINFPTGPVIIILGVILFLASILLKLFKKL